MAQLEKSMEVLRLLNEMEVADVREKKRLAIKWLNIVMVIDPQTIVPRLVIDPLLRVYAREMISDDAKLGAVVGRLEGKVFPAIVREVVERAKLAAIANHDPSRPFMLDPTHLTAAAEKLLKDLEQVKKDMEE